ncbi:LysR family transcriptional regulator [Pseudomonas gingeri]|uniref:LysR family transcriptional regulator n=1 Tax=Pseudomonas gingeri TaxID=117681 RepID=A0A7Y7X7N1_9PSED|nr:LysR substrate-binding domain-containing protein [Pseudomonas gingeri]NWB94717.1 LysR family transcriptional regulator [Pseudomonas gingeri]
MKRLPPLPALHTFLITAQCCNFTRAAEQLHITQGAVSRQIAGLEQHLGYALFQRQARGLSLTAQGRELFPRIQQVFRQLEDAVDQVGAQHPALKLKAPICMIRWLLPRLLQWRKERPEVPVELTTSLQHGVDFRREDFDVAVIYGAPPGPSVTAHHLFDEQLTPVCSAQLKNGAIALERVADLEQHTLLHPTLDQQDWQTWLDAAGVRLGNIGKGQHLETMDVAMSLASQGNGVAIGDWALIGEDLNAGRLVMPFDLRVRTGQAYYLAYPPRSEASAALNELKAWLVAQAGERL